MDQAGEVILLRARLWSGEPTRVPGCVGADPEGDRPGRRPFETILERLDLPPEIVGVGGYVCLAEETLSGRQLTFEGYRYRGETHTLRVVGLGHPRQQSQFPPLPVSTSIPDRIIERMADVSGRIVKQIALEHITFNVEFFWDEETDALSVLEINPRHSQSHAELFALVDGAPNHLAMVRLALGRDPYLPRRRGPYRVAAKWFMRRWSDGARPPPPQRAGDRTGTA